MSGNAIRRQWFERFGFVCLTLISSQSLGDKPDKAGGSGGEKLPPELTFWTDQDAYTTGDSATLQWTSNNTRFCSASGDWGGKLPVSGSYTTQTLSAGSNYSYGLKCSARGGGVEQSISLVVVAADEPAGEGAESPEEIPAPVLQLFAATDKVTSGSTLGISWSADNASTCTASGGWMGTKPTAGTETIGPIHSSSNYSLTCEGAGGSVIEMISIAVISPISINWTPPTENVDGTPLTDLMVYRIYIGPSSRSYVEHVDVIDLNAKSHELQLSSGRHFISMTAIDRDGNESSHSNEIERLAP
jgi:hypothetical protein